MTRTDISRILQGSHFQSPVVFVDLQSSKRLEDREIEEEKFILRMLGFYDIRSASLKTLKTKFLQIFTAYLAEINLRRKKLTLIDMKSL